MLNDVTSSELTVFSDVPFQLSLFWSFASRANCVTDSFQTLFSVREKLCSSIIPHFNSRTEHGGETSADVRIASDRENFSRIEQLKIDDLICDLDI
jgi:hypothetical protein